MFKKFNPKDDVASSTSLKSSVQRHIRSGLMDQIPFLSQPLSIGVAPSQAAFKFKPIDTTGGDDEPATDRQNDETEEADQTAGKKGGKGGKKGGKGPGKKGGKGKDTEDVKESAGAAVEETLLVIDAIWPKKEALGITKCLQRVSIYTLDGTPLVWQHFEGPFIPTLHLLHKYPALLPKVRIDRGAIKFLLAGANMMAPGLLSAGGDLPPGLAEGTIVAIYAEGKEHAAGIGQLSASSDEIRKRGKDVAVEVLCYLGDDLWKVDKLQ